MSISIVEKREARSQVMNTITAHFEMNRGVLCGMDCELCASLVQIVREDEGRQNPADIIPLDEIDEEFFD